MNTCIVLYYYCFCCCCWLFGRLVGCLVLGIKNHSKHLLNCYNTTHTYIYTHIHSIECSTVTTAIKQQQQQQPSIKRMMTKTMMLMLKISGGKKNKQTRMKENYSITDPVKYSHLASQKHVIVVGK